MSIWVKPNGTEIEINSNEETIEYVKSLGWKEKSAKKEEIKKVEVKKKATKKSK